jgi:hypothetical protein
MRKEPAPFYLERVRRIPASFSLIDRRLIHQNVLPYLTKDEKVLYFFLVTVGNRDGVSYYGPRRICLHTGLSAEELKAARLGLEEMDLCAYRFPFNQVLSLPEKTAWAKLSARRFKVRAAGGTS